MNTVSGAVPVVSQAGAWIATGAWGTFLTLLALLVKPIAAQWLPWLRLRSENANERRKEQRTDLSDCKERLDRMAARMDGLYEVVNNLKIELAGVLSAYRVLEVAEIARDPFSLHLAQARAIMSTAFTIAPSTSGPPKSETLRAAEETCQAAEVTVETVKRDERLEQIAKDPREGK